MTNLPYSRHRFEHSPEKTFTSVATTSVPSAFLAKYGMTYSPKVVTTHSVPFKDHSKVVDDWVVPGYKTRSANGEVFCNPFVSQILDLSISGVKEYTYTNVDAYQGHVVDNGKFLLDHWLSGSAVKPNPVLSGETLASQQAKIQALGSVNQTDFDSLTFAGEWSKTKRLHRDLGNAMIKLLQNPRRNTSISKARVKRVPLFDARGVPILKKNGKPAYTYLHEPSKEVVRESFLKDSADLYLVGRYGIGPLLHDLEDACKHLCRSRALRKTARGSYTLASTASVNTTMVGGVLSTETALVQHQRTVSKTVRYGVLYETSAFMSGAGSLGVTRPLSTAWELTPYSFVFDWFLNVGGWLDAIQPSGASKTLCAWESARQITVDTIVVSGSGSTNRMKQSSRDRWDWQCNGQLQATTQTKTRVAWDAVVPTFPALGSGFNSLRSFDFAALVLQRLR